MADGVTVHRKPSTVYGTDEWAEENLRWTRNTLRSAEADCVPIAVNMPHYRAWCGRHGIAWDVFCRERLEADPRWIEKLEEGVAILQARGHAGPVTKVQAVAASQALAADPEVKPAAAVGAPKGNDNARQNNVDSINIDSRETPRAGGTSAEYLVRRIKRDAPEIAEELARGELPSARAAAIKAGIVKVPTMVERAFRLVERMTPAERLDFDRQIRPLIAAAESTS